jgi:hypothetical protein
MCRKLAYSLCIALVLGLFVANRAAAVDPNLIGWWKLDDGSGTTAIDSSGRGNNGTLRNGPVWVAGRIGSALDFDGTNDYVDCGNAAIFNITGQITLSLWVNTDTVTAGTHRSYLLKGDTSYALKQGSPGNIEFFVYIGGWQAVTFPVDTSFNGVWHHLAGTYDGSQIKLYVDGVLRDTKPYKGAIATNAAIVSIGSDSGTRRYCDGRIDDVRIYNCALSMADIKNLANPERASMPIPATGSIISQTEVTLQWDAGYYAALHDVYFGENFADVNIATTYTTPIYKGRQSQNFYPTTGTMAVQLGKTYYWRIDEVRADGTTIDKGEVWSFSVQPLTAYNPSPDDGTKYVDVDPNTYLSWSAGANSTKSKVFFGTSPGSLVLQTTITHTVGVERYSYVKTGLSNNQVYYWRVDEVPSTGPDVTGDVWSFRTVPFTRITDPNLVGWWKLDDGGGSIALDWSGRGNDGTVIGNPNWVAGHIEDGNALDLDGFDDCVNCGNPQDFNIPTQITLAAWVKTDAAGGATQSYVTKMVGGENSSYTLRHIDTDNIEFLIGTASATFPVSSSFNGVWHHLAGTYDGSALRLYVDCSLQATTANVGTIPTSAYNVNIGRDSIGNRFPYDGAIDDVRIYNRALTQAELALIMRGNPLLAWNPSPPNGAVIDIEHPVPLSWSAGENTAQHDVYFGTDAAAVAGAKITTTGIYRSRQTSTTYNPPEALQWGQEYYWRIDEYNKDATITEGRLWSFTVADYLLVDDFEDYNNFSPDRIFQTWLDSVGYSADQYFPVAYNGNGTGAVVGHDIWATGTPYTSIMETTIVHVGGKQSMPMDYNNTKSPYYSETTRIFAASQDWTRLGVKALSLWFRGIPASVGSLKYDQATDTYIMTGSGADIWGTADQFHFAYKTLTGDGSIIARIDSITNTNSWAKAGVMIRETLDPGSPSIDAVISADNRVAMQWRETQGADMGSPDSSTHTIANSFTLPHWMKLTRSGFVFRVQHSADGITWQDIVPETAGDPLSMSISMGTTVYIGLVVTAHNASATCEAKISNVSITTPSGSSYSPTGPFTVSQDIGIASNDPAPLYVTLEEDTGGKKTVNNTNDPNAVLQNTWQEWNIALSEFTSVKLDRIKKMTIGVGNKTPGGTGSLYFDDIRLYRPRCVPSKAKPGADVTGDCVVNYSDLDAMIAQWLSTTTGLSVDLNTDNRVDLKDFAVLTASWLEEKLWP